jgi:hypothetical protein
MGTSELPSIYFKSNGFRNTIESIRKVENPVCKGHDKYQSVLQTIT